MNPENRPADKSEGQVDEELKDDLEDWSIIPPKTYAFYVARFLLRYAKYFDFTATSTSITYTGVGTIIIGQFTLKIDLRNIMDNMKTDFVGTLDSRRNIRADETQATCRILLQDFYIANSLDDENPKEFLDVFSLDVGAVLGLQDLSIKDVSLGFKLGRGIVYLEKMIQIFQSMKRVRQEVTESGSKTTVLGDHEIKNLAKLGTLMVRVVKEVELKATYLGIFGIPAASSSTNEVTTFAASAKDLSLDTRRLNPQSPGFKLFFAESDSAHQAIFSMSSVSFGLGRNEGGTQDEIIYVPMVTMISKTNIFSKTLQFVRDIGGKTNESIFRANVNVTSPTVDLEAVQVPILMEAFVGKSQNDENRTTISSTAKSFQRLLPRTAIKFTIDEPAARLLLTPQEDSGSASSRSMVISSSSKIHCDFESSHSNDPENPSYSSNASLQVSSYDTWYRSPSGVRYDVLLSENLFLKINAVMDPTVSVTISGILSNAHVLLTKSEVFRGIREFFLHSKKTRVKKEDKPGNALQRLPPWLSKWKIEIADTAVSVASEQHRDDEDVVRGLTLQMANSVLEYRADKDRRKLAVIMEGIEGYKIIEPFELEKNELNRFLQIPSLSVALGAESSPQLQCNVIMKSTVLKYDLNLHFLALLSVGILEHTLLLDQDSGSKKTTQEEPIGLHVKTGVIRIKVELPNDAHLMLETNNLEMQRKKDVNPRLRATAIRVYSLHPHVPNAWGRIISLKGAHAEYKDKEEPAVNLAFEAMRLNVPSQYIFHRVLDNMVTAFKATLNLQLRYKTGGEHEAVTRPKERSTMPNVPKIRVKTPALMLTLEDDHFESQLGLIFQVGLLEQKIRLDKEKAFEAKVKAIHEAERDAAKGAHATKSTHTPRRRTSASQLSSASSASDLHPVHEDDEKKSPIHLHTPTFTHNHKHNLTPPSRTFHRSSRHEKEPNYTMTSTEGPSEDAQISVEQARERMHENFSRSWIEAFNEAYRAQKGAVRKNIHNCFGDDEITEETAANERIVDYSEDPLLFYALMKDVDLTLRKPDFDDNGLREYLHDVGKGLPRDTKFSLLVPLHVDFKLSETRFQLRDYPLPLLHIPELHPTQDPAHSAMHLKGNLVVAEELWVDDCSLRRINVPVVPLASRYPDDKELSKYIIEVVRTVSSVKIYTDMHAQINTMNPTRITWANSIQPAIQTVMLAFDSFSKPPIDPSTKLGFWDKIRSIFHARLRFDWTEGDVFLMLKGSRSPYSLVGAGAGFVMGWRNNVSLKVNETDNPKELLIADSEEYILAVPNYVGQERDYLRKANVFQHALLPKTNFNESTNFRKVVMKLSGRVQWVAGLLFEMDKKGSSERTSDFRPHYDVQLRQPDSIEDLQHYDAYEGFRSQYTHMAITVASPQADDSNSYNTAHLTPRVLHHFRDWWGLFDGSLSLPTRAGKLFQEKPVKKPKFGRHLFTVKYKLLLSPLYITHNYRHPHSEDLTKNNKQASTGLKGKVDSFSMDLHQRREQEKGKRWKMKVHMGELDFKSADLRVIMAQFKERSPQELLAKKLGIGQSPASSINNDNGSSSMNQSQAHLSGKFKISDNDFSWIDMDDYVEMDDAMPMKNLPKITVLPLVYAPRWTYFRQTDHSNEDTVKAGGREYAKFGNEPAHDCLIGRNHPETTQHELLKQRVDEIDEQLKTDDATLDSLKKDLQEYPDEPNIKSREEAVKSEIDNLTRRKQAILNVVNARRGSLDGNYTEDNASFLGLEDLTNPQTNENLFNNRFIIHNVQLKWNNAARNAVYRYMHKVGDRRAFSYFITRKAVKYVEDLINMQNEPESSDDEGDSDDDDDDNESEVPSSTSARPSSSRERGHTSFGDVFHGELGDAQDIKNFDSELRQVAEGLGIDDTYLVRLTSPQIQLVSDQNPDQCVLVTSQNIELKVLSVMDEQENNDEVSALVESRYGVLLQDAQFFVLDRQDVARGSLVLFSSNTYGCSQMSSSWPPWLALEMCYESSPLQSNLVVDRTSATLRYDKPNSLRVQQGSATETSEGISSKVVRCEQNRANRVSVDFPKVVANCDSQQYFAVYTIVIDLLIYSEPGSQRTSENLEEVLLATDFSDLNGAVERLNDLQDEIRQLQDLRNEFAIKLGDQMDERVKDDWIKIEVEIHHNILELMVMMRAIRTGIQKGHRDTTQFLKWSIAAEQIIWHVLGPEREPFLDIGLADASFNRIEGGDGYNSNTVEVGMMQGFNLLPKSLYPELFSPFCEAGGVGLKRGQDKLIYVEWTMLDPIGGIPIVENFYVKLLPMKLQLEHDTGQKIFEYIFPSNEESPFMVSRMGSKRGEESGEERRPSASNYNTDDDDDSSDDEDGDDDESAYKPLYGHDLESVTSSKAAHKNWMPSQGGHPRASKMLAKSSSFANHRSGQNSRRASVDVSNDTNSTFSRRPGRAQGNSNSNSNRTSSVYSGRSSSRHRDHSSSNDKETDFAVMVKRASNYMSIVDIKIDSTTLCISYKGHGSRNLTDIHEFVIRLPAFEYKNKTWSNLDLALRLKKDVIKTLFQHTGALISNKFTKRHRRKAPSKPLRQISNYVSFTSVADLADPEQAAAAQQARRESQTQQRQESTSAPATPPPPPQIQVSGPSQTTADSSQSSPTRSPPPSSSSASANASAAADITSSSSSSSSANGLKSRAASFVKGIVGNSQDASSPPSGRPGSLVQSDKSQEGLTPTNNGTQNAATATSPLSKMRRALSDDSKATAGGDDDNNNNNEEHGGPPTYNGTHTTSSSDQNDSWGTSDDDVQGTPFSDDEDKKQHDEPERAEQEQEKEGGGGEEEEGEEASGLEPPAAINDDAKSTKSSKKSGKKKRFFNRFRTSST